MLTSKALILGTTLFAIFAFYGIFHSLYQTQLKFEDTSKANLLSHNDNKWFKHKTRVVMVIIDAFRFDYLLNYKSFDKDPAMKNHKLERFNHEFFKHPEKFVVVRALADLPTMTVLRVPCLMTGNVPRLGSVLTAFGALPAEEDSVPRQLHLQNKKSYFSGDPILKEYFPEYLESDYKIGSFNIEDWTVDQPVQAYTNKKLAENKFDFLVAHLLRLDHAGHSGGVAGHQSLKALKDVDRFLVSLIENIPDDTMLIFGGDHGMVAPGSHGGGSKQETNTAIVAYHKKGFKKYHKKNKDLSKIMRSVNETTAQVHQIDLAPTLSMLMGLPTPFSNMGQILNDLYPNGHYFDHHPECPNTTAFEPGFDMQLLHDNKLNTVQVWNYFKKYHEGQSLFSDEEFSEASDLYNEASKAYHKAEKLIKEDKVCTASFHKATIKAIQKSQQLSNLVHDMVSNKPPHDLVIFWQSFALLLLVCVSYTLLIQYLYKTKDYERFTVTWSHPSTWDWKGLAKRTAPLTITLALIWIYMWARDYRMMRPVTSTALVLAIWLLKFSVFSFISQPQEDVSFESIPSSPTNEVEERRRHVFSLKKLFIFQNPLITAGALAIIALLFYLTHARHVQKNDIADLRKYNPYVFILLAGLRLSGRYLKFSPYIMAVSVLLCKGLSIEHYKWFWSSKGIFTMGLILVADWIWSEIQFAWKKLKASKIWSFQYLVCFLLLVEYHLHGDPKSEWIQITVPRLVWAILAISSIAGFALKMPRNVIKRNIQVNLVLYLTLMQLHRKLLFFGIVLSIYRITNYLFRRVQFKNYLYPLILGFISYFGLLSIGFGDRKLPRNFEPAFVGMHEFHLALCLMLYASAMLTTIILGMLFISFYNQDLELQEVELGSPKEETSDAQVVALKGHSNLIKKRNLIFYGFFYCLLMLGAAINPVVMKNHKKIYLSMERFLVDGALFLFTINAVCFVF